MDRRALDRLALEAVSALRDNEYMRLVSLTEQLLTERPDDPDFNTWRAVALFEVGNPREALAAADRAISHGGDALAYLVRARSAAGINRKAQAREAYQVAIELSGQEPGPMAECALYMAYEMGPRPAEEMARKALEADPSSCRAWTALGLAQFRQSRFAEAESSLQRTLEIDPDNQRAIALLGLVKASSGKEMEAEHLSRLITPEGTRADTTARALRDYVQKRRLNKKLLQNETFLQPVGGAKPERGIRRFLSGAAWVLLVGLLTGAALYGQDYVHPVGVLGVAVLLLLILWSWRR